jgi:hypothetical protein
MSTNSRFGVRNLVGSWQYFKQLVIIFVLTCKILEFYCLQVCLCAKCWIISWTVGRASNYAMVLVKSPKHCQSNFSIRMSSIILD